VVEDRGPTDFHVMLFLLLLCLCNNLGQNFILHEVGLVCTQLFHHPRRRWPNAVGSSALNAVAASTAAAVTSWLSYASESRISTLTPCPERISAASSSPRHHLVAPHGAAGHPVPHAQRRQQLLAARRPVLLLLGAHQRVHMVHKAQPRLRLDEVGAKAQLQRGVNIRSIARAARAWRPA
jgi:hypothetical protein